VSNTIVRLAIRRFLDRFGDPEESWRPAKERVAGALRRFQAAQGRRALVLDAD
jgi:hypothetical protein